MTDSSGMSSNKFFIIDDDAEDTELLADALCKVEGSCQCFTATNGEQGLQKLKEGLIPIPDYIFLDLNMPRLDGRQFLIKIKRIKVFSQIPIIIYTTSSDARDREETKRLGAFYFLTKPDSFNEICKGLSIIFSLHNTAI